MPCRPDPCEGCEVCYAARVEFQRSGTVLADRFPEYGNYRIVRNGKRPGVNYWEKRRYADQNHPNKNTYYYNNDATDKNGSQDFTLFWQYPDWQTLYINKWGGESWGISKDKPWNQEVVKREKRTALPTPPASPERLPSLANRGGSRSFSEALPSALNQDGEVVHLDGRNLYDRFRDQLQSATLGSPAIKDEAPVNEEHNAKPLAGAKVEEQSLDASPICQRNEQLLTPKVEEVVRLDDRNLDNSIRDPSPSLTPVGSLGPSIKKDEHVSEEHDAKPLAGVPAEEQDSDASPIRQRNEQLPTPKVEEVVQNLDGRNLDDRSRDPSPSPTPVRSPKPSIKKEEPVGEKHDAKPFADPKVAEKQDFDASPIRQRIEVPHQALMPNVDEAEFKEKSARKKGRVRGLFIRSLVSLFCVVSCLVGC